MAALSARLAQGILAPTEQAEGEMNLERYQEILSGLRAGDGRYLISPEALEGYRPAGICSMSSRPMLSSPPMRVT